MLETFSMTDFSSQLLVGARRQRGRRDENYRLSLMSLERADGGRWLPPTVWPQIIFGDETK